MPDDTRDPLPTYTFSLDGSEKLIRPADVAALFERLTGRRPHANAIRRLHTKGARGLVLPSLLIGGTRFCSEAAVRWWISTSNTIDAKKHATARTIQQPRQGAPLTGSERATLAKFGIAEGA